LLCFFLHFPSTSFLYKTERFGDWILSPSFVDWVQLNRFLPEDAKRIHFPKRCVLYKKEDDGICKKHNNYINVSLSQEGYVSENGLVLSKVGKLSRIFSAFN
jgi:hypothetical protein